MTIHCFSIHHCNWQSAENDPETVQELIDKEVQEGWVEVFDGSLEDAQLRWPTGVAIGKLGLALSDSRPPRLVMDSSICGVNSRCHIPERSTLPTARDVLGSYPLRNSNDRLDGFSLDIKSAHKRIAVAERYRGLLGFQFRNTLYFYKVCPFGATFSAHFWSRLGGFLLRLWHRLVWLPHAGFLYVDDFYMFQCKQLLSVSATLICALCLICKIPVSWKKCEIGPTIRWICWILNVRIGIIMIPTDKRQKLAQLLKKLKTSSTTSRKTLEQFLGLAMWVTQVFPLLRTWLHWLYKALHSIPASHYSISPDLWPRLCAFLTDDLHFHTVPPGSAIPLRSHLISVRHRDVSTKADIRTCHVRDRRIWLRLRDADSSKRKVSSDSCRILALFDLWLRNTSPIRSMWPKALWTGYCVADAFASNCHAGIGGLIRFPSGMIRWFSLQLSSADFSKLQIPMHTDLQKDISSLETLAQHALIFIASRLQPGLRVPIRIPSLSDNTAAESVTNTLFSTSMPLALFLEKICILLSSCGMEVDTSHIAGHDNDLADKLSRWDGIGQVPFDLLVSDRFEVSLHELWLGAPRARLRRMYRSLGSFPRVFFSVLLDNVTFSWGFLGRPHPNVISYLAIASFGYDRPIAEMRCKQASNLIQQDKRED